MTLPKFSTTNILQSLTAKSENIVNALRAKSPLKLSWTHYSIILQENNKEARDWYEQESEAHPYFVVR